MSKTVQDVASLAKDSDPKMEGSDVLYLFVDYFFSACYVKRFLIIFIALQFICVFCSNSLALFFTFLPPFHHCTSLTHSFLHYFILPCYHPSVPFPLILYPTNLFSTHSSYSNPSSPLSLSVFPQVLDPSMDLRTVQHFIWGNTSQDIVLFYRPLK